MKKLTKFSKNLAEKVDKKFNNIIIDLDFGEEDVVLRLSDQDINFLEKARDFIREKINKSPYSYEELMVDEIVIYKGGRNG